MSNMPPINEDPAKATKFGEYKLLPLGSLTTDGTYQRVLSQWAVRSIVTHYEPILFQPLIIGRRAGLNFIIDGQHRHAAAIEKGFKEVPCMVYKTESAAQEAQIFIWLQERRRILTSAQRFKAKLEIGDKAARAIDRMLRHFKYETSDYEGFKIHGARDNVILAVATLERIYGNDGGGEILENVLIVCREAWDGRSSALRNNILAGLATFMMQNQYGIKALVQKMKALSPFDITMAAEHFANTRGLGRVDATAMAIANAYANAPLRSIPKRESKKA
jgi:ParB-like nuclease domain